MTGVGGGSLMTPLLNVKLVALLLTSNVAGDTLPLMVSVVREHACWLTSGPAVSCGECAHGS